mmetsp:Transcript_43248/g.112085  ORF Transcript_43248/g.112085 Transcript_43248/m.112085 type:complete len:314 (-) Transcript_43248:54-995(-)
MAPMVCAPAATIRHQSSEKQKDHIWRGSCSVMSSSMATSSRAAARRATSPRSSATSSSLSRVPISLSAAPRILSPSNLSKVGLTHLSSAPSSSDSVSTCHTSSVSLGRRSRRAWASSRSAASSVLSSSCRIPPTRAASAGSPRAPVRSLSRDCFRRSKARSTSTLAAARAHPAQPVSDTPSSAKPSTPARRDGLSTTHLFDVWLAPCGMSLPLNFFMRGFRSRVNWALSRCPPSVQLERSSRSCRRDIGGLSRAALRASAVADPPLLESTLKALRPTEVTVVCIVEKIERLVQHKQQTGFLASRSKGWTDEDI